MRSLIVQQFRPLHSGTLCEQWLAVKQTGTVAEFRQKFIEMASPIEHIPESMLMAHFVNGLKDEIRVEVRMLGLYTLEQAMDLALKVEEKNRIKAGKSGEGKVLSDTSARPNSLSQIYATSKNSGQSHNLAHYTTGLTSPIWGSKSESGSISPISWSQPQRSYSQTS